MLNNNLTREKKVAKKIIKKHFLSPPVDVVALLTQYGKLEEDSLPQGVDAVCIMNESESIVFVDRFQHLNRKRFTIAHELGHLVLPWHYGMISCNTDIKDDIDQTAYSTMEFEANSFASEILMPSDWIQGLISNADIDLEVLVSDVSDIAQTSKEAAFYSILNNLSDEYIVLVRNYNKAYDKLYFSKTGSILIPYKSGSYYDIEWLNQISETKGQFNIESLEITWWKLNIYLPVNFFNTLLTQVVNNDLTNALESLTNYSKASFAIGLKKFVDLLPSSYIIYVYNQESEKLFQSIGTNVRVTPGNAHKFIQQNAFMSNEFTYNGYNVIWGYFSIERPAIVVNPFDKRKSTDILKEILRDNVPDAATREHLMRSFNGVLGALNNKAPRIYDEFYRMLKEKLIGLGKYHPITNHSQFELYVYKRINELINK